MFFNKLFKKDKIENPDYESSLENKGTTLFDKNIKLLVISDTHGDLSLSKDMYKKLKNVDYDLCCILGDIPDYDYKVIFKYIPKDKIVAILGNHDRFGLLSEQGLNDINGKVIDINGVRIGAIQGSYKYKNEAFPSFTHETSIEFLNKMSEVDILLSHDKPFTYDYKDPAHDGLKGITYFLYKNRVPINIHGHIHKSYLSNLKNGTQVKGVYCVELIDIKNGKIINK